MVRKGWWQNNIQHRIAHLMAQLPVHDHTCSCKYNAGYRFYMVKIFRSSSEARDAIVVDKFNVGSLRVSKYTISSLVYVIRSSSSRKTASMCYSDKKLEK